MKKRIGGLLLAALIAFTMTACKGEAPSNANASPATEAGTAVDTASNAYTGGILKVAISSASPFAGLFNMLYTIDMLDTSIVYWLTEPLLSMDDNISYDQDGAATYTYDKEARTMTLTMKPGVKWHDGEPVTMEDLVFAYEILANPVYEGYFFTETISYIKGVNEYKNGEADTITGFELSADKQQLTIHFTQFMPSILEGGIWTYPLPKHQLSEVAIADMASDERSRSQAIGFGPYKIKSVIPGETVELVSFDEYWQGKPKLDGVTLTVVNPDMVPSAMEQGLYDISTFPASAYADHQSPSNYAYRSSPDRWYQLTGFHLGHFDGEKGENVTDPDAKMNNLSLRQAIGYATDLESICRDFYQGLYGINPTVLPPDYKVYQNPAVTGYPYDPEKAKALLDEAGYKDIDGDGLREMPDGSPLVITWAVPNNNNETVVQYKIQGWRDVGLNVRLMSEKLMDVNAYYDMLFQDDASIDMFEMGWVIEASPNLQGAWGRNAIVNFTRFANEEMDALLNAIDSDAAWDSAYRTQAYYNFEKYFFEQSPAIPTVWRSNLYAVNNRVKNFSLTAVQIESNRHLIELTQENPVVK